MTPALQVSVTDPTRKRFRRRREKRQTSNAARTAMAMLLFFTLLLRQRLRIGQATAENGMLNTQGPGITPQQSRAGTRESAEQEAAQHLTFIARALAAETGPTKVTSLL